MSNIISTGTTFHIYDSSVQTHDTLPADTYKVRFNPMSGYSLQRVDDLKIVNEKIYGNLSDRADKVLRTYLATDRSLGIMATGDKGMGKTMLLREIASKARGIDIPTIIVDKNYPGLADFLDTIGESVIVFDEFEKNFECDEEGEDAQAQLLSLFDGMSSTKRMYVVTANHTWKLNDFLVNRPGRFHYHFRFTYPTDEDIRVYLTDKNVNPVQIGKIVSFAKRIKINYDHLRAIAFELSFGSDFEDVINDLNIKFDGNGSYDLVVKTDKGTWSGQIRLGNLSGTVEATTYNDSGEYRRTFVNLEMITGSEDGFHVPAEAVRVREGEGKVISATINMPRATVYSAF